MSSQIHRGPHTAGTSTGQETAPAPASRRRRALLIAAATFAAVAVLAAGAIVAVLFAVHHPRPVAARSSLRGTAFLLRPGQCFNSAPNGINAAHVLPCARPHRSEIYATFAIPGAHWPGTAAVAGRARAGCQGRLSAYVNPQIAAEGLAEIYLYPNEGAWQAGEHRVVCEVRSTAGPITGSVRS